MTKPDAAPEIHTLGGRSFRSAAETTLRQDQYCFGLIHECGLNAVSLQHGETAEAFARRLLGACMSSEKVFHLLGGLIVPTEASIEGWSPKVAAETALFLQVLKRDEDKAIIHGLIASMLADFLIAGISSLEVSSASSSSAGPGAPQANLPEIPSETTDSAIGRDLSGFSPEATMALQNCGGTGG